MSAAEKCTLHGRLFCRDCLIKATKKVVLQNPGDKSSKPESQPKKLQTKMFSNEGAARKKMRFRVDELDEQANFIVLYQKGNESQNPFASSKNNFCRVVSIVEK